jgi:nitronate monooxygenase
MSHPGSINTRIQEQRTGIMSIQELFGIELPIIQAPLAGVQNSALTIAVSNAGGLGSLPCAMLNTEVLRAELETIRAQSVRPFNLNFFSHQPPVPDQDQTSAWQALFADYYAELGIESPKAPSGPARMPFNPEMADLVCEYRPAVVSFHFGLPSPELMNRVRSSGAKIISSATTVDEALWLEAHGVDAIIAQGFEAGGHRGMFLSNDISTQIGTFALLPQIVRAVKVPVIATGGIADASGVRAALDLGAAGVQVGTAYMLCPEATTSAVHRAALKSDSACTTALTNVFSGRPARGIVNRLMRELGPMNPAAPQFPLAAPAAAALRAKAESMGSGDFSPLWAGQNVSGAKEIAAGMLTRALASQINRP